MIESDAPGKLILLGEYAVLFGAPALVTAVERRARVTLEPAEHFRLSALGLDVRAEYANELRIADPRFSLVAAVFDEVLGEGRLPAVAVAVDTEEFYLDGDKLGLGSSAAVAVALADALRRSQGQTSPPSQRFRDAYRAHRRAQGGVGSGVDIAASAFGGVLAYRAPAPGEDTPRDVKRLVWPDALHWRVYWSGRSASTPKLVSAVERLQENEPARARERIDVLTRHAYDAVGDFRAGDVHRFLSTVDAFRAGLEGLGQAAGIDIVSDSHRRIGSIASASGAVYKPSGAGGGDIGVAFAEAPIPAGPGSVELQPAPPIEETT